VQPVFFCLCGILHLCCLQVYFEWFMTVDVLRVICRSKRGDLRSRGLMRVLAVLLQRFLWNAPPSSACVSGGVVFRFKVSDCLPLRCATIVALEF
jgi:hypothetical protein